MSNVPKALYRGNLTAVANTVVGTVPAAKTWILTNLILVNYGTATVTVTVQLDAVNLCSAISLSPGAQYTLDCTQVLASAKQLRAWASAASSIAMHASGVEVG